MKAPETSYLLSVLIQAIFFLPRYFVCKKFKKIIMEQRSGQVWNLWVITVNTRCGQEGNLMAVPFASNIPSFHSYQ